MGPEAARTGTILTHGNIHRSFVFWALRCTNSGVR